MVPFVKTMEKWNATIELEITLLLKDWLKQKGKTQKDLQTILGTSSERMPVLIEILIWFYQRFKQFSQFANESACRT